MPFSKPTLRVESSDGRYFTLLEPLVYTTQSGEVITVPAGSTTDGASTPQAIWNIIPPFGSYWLAAVLHDYLYRLTKRPKDECDNLLREAMISLQVDKLILDAIYQGVHLGGESAFDEDRKADLLIKVRADIEAIRHKLFGAVAQSVERELCKLEAAGASPVSSTTLPLATTDGIPALPTS